MKLGDCIEAKLLVQDPALLECGFVKGEIYRVRSIFTSTKKFKSYEIYNPKSMVWARVKNNEIKEIA